MVIATQIATPTTTTTKSAAAALCEAPHLQVRGAPIAAAAADFVVVVVGVAICVAMTIASEFHTGAPHQVVAAAEARPVTRVLESVFATVFVGELLQRIAELEEEVGLGIIVVTVACPGALVEPAKGFLAARTRTYTPMPVVCQYCEQPYWAWRAALSVSSTTSKY